MCYDALFETALLSSVWIVFLGCSPQELIELQRKNCPRDKGRAAVIAHRADAYYDNEFARGDALILLIRCWVLRVEVSLCGDLVEEAECMRKEDLSRRNLDMTIVWDGLQEEQVANEKCVL